jgi:hypothetical protein
MLRGRLGQVAAVAFGFLLAFVAPYQVRVVKAQGLGQISGRVTDSNGDPLAGLRVGVYALERSFVETARDGTYTVPSVPHASGPYQVQLLAPCQRDQSRPVIVNGSEVVNFTVPASDERGVGLACHRGFFRYVEATNVLPLTGDDQSTAVALPFSFSFSGQSFSTVFVSTNGFVNFLGNESQVTNTQLPSSSAPNAAIYAFWDDLVVDASASVRTETFPGVFVIEWRNVRFLDDLIRRLDFELWLSSGGGIQMLYRNIDVRSQSQRERGLSATVGVENIDGTKALQRSFNQPLIENNTAAPEFNFSTEFVTTK